jgi:hypothetical protein
MVFAVGCVCLAFSKSRFPLVASNALHSVCAFGALHIWAYQLYYADVKRNYLCRLLSRSFSISLH